MYYTVCFWVVLVVHKYVLQCFGLYKLKFFWCPCMAINVSVQYNGGLPNIILLTQCYYQQLGNPFKCHENVLSLQPMIPPY